MNILVLSHAANRSGAPLSLLTLVRWLRARGEDSTRVYSLRSGPMETEFEVESDAALRVLRRASLLEAARKRAPSSRLVETVFVGLQSLNARAGRRALDRYLRATQIEVVLANSVASGAALRVLGPLLKRRKIGVVVWVHEMQSARAQFAGDWNWCRRYADRFVAASEAVRAELIGEGIAPARIEVVYEMIDFAALAVDVDKNAARRELRARLELPAEAFVVGGCGTMEARKGFDWWPQIAARVPNARFVWLGGDPKGAELARARGARRWAPRSIVCPRPTIRAGFSRRWICFVCPRAKTRSRSSRSKRRLRALPLVCFADAGGVPELVGNAGGICVPLADVAAMARALETLRLDQTLRLQMGESVATRARQLSDVEINAPRLRAILAANRVNPNELSIISRGDAERTKHTMNRELN